MAATGVSFEKLSAKHSTPKSLIELNLAVRLHSESRTILLHHNTSSYKKQLLVPAVQECPLLWLENIVLNNENKGLAEQLGFSPAGECPEDADQQSESRYSIAFVCVPDCIISPTMMMYVYIAHVGVPVSLNCQLQ